MTNTDDRPEDTATIKFEEIYKANYSRLYTLAFRMTGTTENAEDVLQTAFLEAFRAFPKFRFESSPYTWLYRIVLNAARAYILKWEKIPTETYAESHDMSLQAVYAYFTGFGQVEDEALIARVRESCLQMFMNCMPAKYRTVYTLRGMLHLSVEDTADILEISEDSVKTRLHRARQLAKDHLDGRCSLMKPGGLCNCRGMAGYVKHNGSTTQIQDITVVRRLEQTATCHFVREMAELLNVDALFATELMGINYTAFKSNLKSMVKEKKLTLLSS